MIFLRSKTIFALVFSLSLSAVSQSAPVLEDDRAPKSWYLVDDFADPDDLEKDHFGPSNGFKYSLKSLLRAQGKAFDQLSNKIEKNQSENAEFFGFRLAKLSADLGLSAGGSLGLLGLKGSIAADVFWTRKGAHSEEVEALQDLSLNDPILEISAEESEEILDTRLFAIAHAAFKSGKVKDRDLMFLGLKKVSQEAQAMMRAVPNTRHMPFSLTKFRIQLSVAASGQVYEGISVGGELRLRLEFKPSKNPRNFRAEELVDGGFAGLVYALSADFHKLTQKPGGHLGGFRLGEVEVGVGITAKAKFGIVKGSVYAGGHLMFKPNKHFVYSHELQLSAGGPKYIYLIGPQLNQMAVQKAGERNISVTSVNLKMASEQSGDMVKLDRRKFRKGLKRAQKMGGFFAKYAGKTRHKHWHLSKVRTAFSLGLSGGIGVVTLGGKITLRTSFVR